jgi:mono/diheme cytochrome c family protein
MNSKGTIAAIFFYLVAAAWLASAARDASAAQQDAGRSVWSGVYTEEQAKRGHVAYVDACAKCHAVELMGDEDAPALTGEAFLSKWSGRTVGDLFDKIRLSMPDDSPGTLSKQEAADIVAYIFRESQFPTGRQELAHETAPLKQIQIEAKRD